MMRQALRRRKVRAPPFSRHSFRAGAIASENPETMVNTLPDRWP